jgi:hypothetical protein
VYWLKPVLIRNSEDALLCLLGGQGQPPAVICSWGASDEPIARPHEGQFRGRALARERAGLEPLDAEREASARDRRPSVPSRPTPHARLARPSIRLAIPLKSSQRPC